MKLNELMQMVSQGNPPKYSVWVGTETNIMDLYIKKICSNNMTLVYKDTVSDVVSSARTRSFDKSIKLYVCIDDVAFLSDKHAQDALKEVRKKTSHHIILIYNKLDKKKKFYLDNKKDIVEFSKLTADVLVNHVRQKCQELSQENIKNIIEMCDCSYGRVMLEVNKLNIYAKVNGIDVSRAFSELSKQDAFTKEIGDITFKLTDYICSGFVDGSIKTLQDAKAKQEPAIMINSICYNNFKDMLAYECLGCNKKDAVTRTGLPYWRIKQVENLQGGFTIKEIIRNINICTEIDNMIKTGELSNDIALDYIVVQLLK